MNFNNLPRFVFDGRNVTYENGSDTAINLMDPYVVNKLLRQGCIVGDTVESLGLDGVNKGLNVDENGVWHPCKLDREPVYKRGEIIKDGLVNDFIDDKMQDLWDELELSNHDEDDVRKSLRELKSNILDLSREVRELKSEIKSLKDVIKSIDIKSDDMTLVGFFDELDNK